MAPPFEHLGRNGCLQGMLASFFSFFHGDSLLLFLFVAHSIIKLRSAWKGIRHTQGKNRSRRRNTLRYHSSGLRKNCDGHCTCLGENEIAIEKTPTGALIIVATFSVSSLFVKPCPPLPFCPLDLSAGALIMLLLTPPKIRLQSPRFCAATD